MNRKNDGSESAEESLVRAKSDALRLLSFGPRSIEEMRWRLARRKYDDGTIENVIETLKRGGFLDDAKFAKLFAASRIYTHPAGKRNLAFELKKKGLPPELVRTTLEGLGQMDEKAMARDLVRRRFQKMTGLAPRKKKARLFGFLRRRGFGTDAIFSVLDELFKDGEEG